MTSATRPPHLMSRAGSKRRVRGDAKLRHSRRRGQQRGARAEVPLTCNQGRHVAERAFDETHRAACCKVQVQSAKRDAVR